VPSDVAAPSVVSEVSSAVLAEDVGCGDFVLAGEDSSFAGALSMATRLANANARKRQDDTRHIPQAP
jgi:hypothetical protein